MVKNSLSFARLREVSWGRAKQWHAGKPWSASDWMTALVGELGEAANVIKKLNRIRDGLPGNKPGVTEASLRAHLAEELADTQIYLDLLAAAVGVDLGEAVRAKFNATSELLGFSERL
jgi:NTP pyrophosphatase (non-canonical NTP hydrolase)